MLDYLPAGFFFFLRVKTETKQRAKGNIVVFVFWKIRKKVEKTCYNGTLGSKSILTSKTKTPSVSPNWATGH